MFTIKNKNDIINYIRDKKQGEMKIMKIIRNITTILFIILLTTIILCGSVNAASSIRASKSSITVGNTVSVTVSFGQKESAAQFKLNYDKSKFDYVSCSAGSFGTATNSFVYINYEDVADLGSVTLTFRAKETGTGVFSISGVVLSSDNSSISTGSTSVKIEAKSTSTGSNSNTNTGNKRPTSNNNSNKNQNTTSEKNNEPEVIEKLELNTIKQELEGKIETDYTEESWKALQEAIASAENAQKSEDYEAIKEKLSIDTLVKVSFEKEELDKVLRDLIGKVRTDYTEESWNELQEAIKTADNVELKSEYDAIKDKLTINTLILDEKTFVEGLINSPCGHGEIIIALSAVIVLLFIIIIILLILNRKSKKVANIGRRSK